MLFFSFDNFGWHKKCLGSTTSDRDGIEGRLSSASRSLSWSNTWGMNNEVDKRRYQTF